LSPCQSTDQIDWHAWSIFRAWWTIALGFQCVDFCVNNNYMMQLLQSCITASIWVWFASLDVENSHVCAAARIWMKRQFWILPVHGRQGTCVLVLARIPNKQLLGILRCRRLAAESVGISLAGSLQSLSAASSVCVCPLSRRPNEGIGDFQDSQTGRLLTNGLPATAKNAVATGLHGARDGLAWRTAVEDLINSCRNFRLCDTVQAPLHSLGRRQTRHTMFRSAAAAAGK